MSGETRGLKGRGEMKKGIGTPKVRGLQGRGETRGCKREGRCRGLQWREEPGRLPSSGDTQGLQWRREMQRAGRERGDPRAASERRGCMERGDLGAARSPTTPHCLSLLPVLTAGHSGMHYP